MNDLITLITNNGIGVVCVGYLIYFQNSTMKNMIEKLSEISNSLVKINERLEIIEKKKGK